jgi:hypothetical protein
VISPVDLLGRVVDVNQSVEEVFKIGFISSEEGSLRVEKGLGLARVGRIWIIYGHI